MKYEVNEIFKNENDLQSIIINLIFNKEKNLEGEEIENDRNTKTGIY